jgi:hypothetical protein
MDAMEKIFTGVLSDEFQVASCLQQHRNRVSQACRIALQGHAR